MSQTPGDPEQTTATRRLSHRHTHLAAHTTLTLRRKGLNRPGMSGDSSSWKGWGHVRWFIEEVPAGAA
ncbi:hypothetical protein B5817_18290 [Mycobacterium tuberculosis]|nr:hypothetical protein B5817_18290 [Mycobacterium tuberculosis]